MPSQSSGRRATRSATAVDNFRNGMRHMSPFFKIVNGSRRETGTAQSLIIGFAYPYACICHTICLCQLLPRIRQGFNAEWTPFTSSGKV